MRVTDWLTDAQTTLRDHRSQQKISKVCGLCNKFDKAKLQCERDEEDNRRHDSQLEEEVVSDEVSNASIHHVSDCQSNLYWNACERPIPRPNRLHHCIITSTFTSNLSHPKTENTTDRHTEQDKKQVVKVIWQRQHWIPLFLPFAVNGSGLVSNIICVKLQSLNLKQDLDPCSHFCTAQRRDRPTHRATGLSIVIGLKLQIT